MVKRRAPKKDPDQLPLFAPVELLDTPPRAHEIMNADYIALLNRLEKNRRRFYSKEEYYQSQEWAAKRRQKKEQVGYRCERCGRGVWLDVHHLNYSSLYDERMEDLMVVCRSCHYSADRLREYHSAYDTWLEKRYGDNAWMCDDEGEMARFDYWLDLQGDW